MAATPRLKAFNRSGEYVACFKNEEDAAAFMALQGEGAFVSLNHSRKYAIWIEGAEAYPAGESYDQAASVMRERQEPETRFPILRSNQC